MIFYSNIYKKENYRGDLLIRSRWCFDFEDEKTEEKTAVYIPIIGAKKSRYKNNPRTMIYSRGRQGYPI